MLLFILIAGIFPADCLYLSFFYCSADEADRVTKASNQSFPQIAKFFNVTTTVGL